MKIFKKKKLYSYLVYYHFESGVGSIIINLKDKIKSSDDILEISQHIQGENGLKKVAIASYQLIGIKKIKED